MCSAIAAARSREIRIAAARGTDAGCTHWFGTSAGRPRIMRWKISHGNHDHGGHDPRQIDLIAIIALLIVIIAAFKFYSDSFESAPSTTAFIVPSQSVHW
jgi:hypothetical protein